MRKEVGLVSAQLVDPLTRMRVGPVVDAYVSEGAPGLPSRLGLVFFYRLIGCQVHWDLEQRVWCVEYP
jgi:hypothetical protein